MNAGKTVCDGILKWLIKKKEKMVHQKQMWHFWENTLEIYYWYFYLTEIVCHSFDKASD